MIRIRGQYKENKPETVDTASSTHEAEHLLSEYRLAFGRDWKLWITGAPKQCQHPTPFTRSHSGAYYCRGCGELMGH